MAASELAIQPGASERAAGSFRPRSISVCTIVLSKTSPWHVALFTTASRKCRWWAVNSAPFPFATEELFGPSDRGTIRASSVYGRSKWNDGPPACVRTPWPQTGRGKEWSAMGQQGHIVVEFDQPSFISSVRVDFGCTSRWRIDVLPASGEWDTGCGASEENEGWTIKKGGRLSLTAEELGIGSDELVTELKLLVANDKRYGAQSIGNWYTTVKCLSIQGTPIKPI